jgi:transcriptional regulator with XRE-family HTH domain
MSAMEINRQIKTSRIAKGYTLTQLANATGFTKGYLSKIERAKQPPPVSTLLVLSKALGKDLNEFFETRPEAEQASGSRNMDFIKLGQAPAEGAKVKSRWYEYKPLIKQFKNKYMSPFLMTVKKGKTDMFAHDSEEFDYVVSGEIILHYEGKNNRFVAGESFYIDSRIKHGFENKQTKDAVLVSVIFNYKRY